MPELIVTSAFLQQINDGELDNGELDDGGVDDGVFDDSEFDDGGADDRAVVYDDEDHQSSTSYKPALWSSRNFARELDQEPMMIKRKAIVMMLMNFMIVTMTIMISMMGMILEGMIKCSK